MTFRNLLWAECIFFVVHGIANVQVVHEWKYIDYVWNSVQQKQNAIDSGNYVANSCIPFDMDQAPDGRIFVTVVRNEGVPASLSTVSNKVGKGGPLLEPYPNWSWYNNKSQCTGITSVWRVAIKCNLLYVLDCGKIADTKVCPPQLLIFDLTSDQLLKRIIIPDDVATNSNGTGLLTNPVVYNKGWCGNVLDTNVVFMSDTEGYGLVVYNGHTKRFSRMESPYFEADPNADQFTVNGDSFQIADGLLGLSLTRNLLYFRPLASYNMYHTNVDQILSSKNPTKYFKERTKLRSQSAAQAFSKDGILFFSSSTEMSILCWNRYKPFTPKNIVTVLQNNERLQFASGMKTHDNLLYIMTNRYQKVAAGTMNFSDINFRIILGNIHTLVRGTNCVDDKHFSFY